MINNLPYNIICKIINIYGSQINCIREVCKQLCQIYDDSNTFLSFKSIFKNTNELDIVTRTSNFKKLYI